MNPGWRESARDELADIWVMASPEDRERIEAAVLATETLLRADPHHVGESRFEDFRLVHTPPLTFSFRAPEGNPVATGEHVHRPRRN